LAGHDAPKQRRALNKRHKEKPMSRKAGDRYECEACGAVLVYEKPCPCAADMPHVEICCGKQMKKKDKQ
jgi:hypothetical protein